MRDCSEHGTNSNVCEDSGCFEPAYVPSRMGLSLWCNKCGALVLNRKLHDKWHAELQCKLA